jgi:hypothetical protein
MGEFDLIGAVQPTDGWYAIVGIKGDAKRQEIVETREEANKQIAYFLRRKYNVFFGVAKYIDDSSRTKRNVRALKSFWLDIDCGPSKSYPTQSEGISALQQFCQTTGLPKPIIVNSGRGLHVYWALDKEVSRDKWEPVAARLKEVCGSQGLHVDNSCFEAARILRVPGTFNFKGDDPAPVEVITRGKPISYEAIRGLLGVKSPTTALFAGSPRQPLSPLGKLIQSNMEASFSKIMRRGENGCAQLNDCYENRAQLSEPRWFSALSIAKFCTDRDKAVYRMSADYPDYDPHKTEQKLEHIIGPHTCVEFEKNNPGLCEACPHFNKIKSPIALGKAVIKAPEEGNTVEAAAINGEIKTYHIPEFPFPYVRGKNGGIFRKGIEDEEDDMLVFPYDFYIVKRMDDPVDGDVVLMRFHTPQDGVREFVVSSSKVMDGVELRKLLASKGIVSGKKQFDLIVDYVIKSFSQIFDKNKAEKMRNQFGWVDNDSKFIVGDREISVEGTYHSPPSSATRVLADRMVPNGNIEKWKEVFNLYGRPGLEAHAFAAATAFGAPLLRFSGQRGAIINVVHPNSGTGKTTILHMCNSVWGDPEKLCAKSDDTFNSKVFKLGVYCNLPVTFDEMSNTEEKQLSDLAYLITQGTGKDRMKASSNELRLNLTSWQTIALCSSNHSFYEKLENLKKTPQGEMMRIIEYNIDYSDAVDTRLGKEMFDHQLLENFGFAGDIYARFILAKYDEVKALYHTIQQRIDTRLKLTQRERFWSATVAANITGIYVAVHLGLCDWGVARIFKWACRMILSLRGTLTPPPGGDRQVLGEFIIGRMSNILIVNGNADCRSKMQAAPLLEPKQDLMIRYEPDTARVYITAGSFRQYCATHSISYRATLAKMKESGIHIKSEVKRMSKGMRINTPGVQSLVFDANHPDFISLTDLVAEDKAEEADA